VLPRGGTDGQSPHTEDEIYFVVSGRARFRAGDEDRAVTAGDTLFVAAGLPHRFHDIEEDLTLLVVFGPAEGTRS
jgi:mannose-6-phosphate isomerase-like protein (cupin superfamily)